jgi:FHA domain
VSRGTIEDNWLTARVMRRTGWPLFPIGSRPRVATPCMRCLGGALSLGMAKPRPSKPSTGDVGAGIVTASVLSARASLKTPVRTDPLPEEQRGAWYDGADVITGIREYDGAVEFELPRDVGQFTIGASQRKCTHALPGRGLSAVHCLLERRGDRLRLIDQQSTNGMYFQDRKVSDISIAPGATFTLAPVTFMAMNDEMREHRSTIVDVIGTGFAPSPDKFIIDFAMGSSNLLLTGEPNCGQDLLARAVHKVSLRRRRALVERAELPEERVRQREVIDSASRSTLVLTIADGQQQLDPTFCAMLFSPSYHVRVIVLASTIDQARKVFTRDAVDQMQHLWVRPLALRTHDIDRLLDRMFAERNASVRTADLMPENLAALRAYHWPENLASLRMVADEIVAHATHDGLRPAAKVLGMAKSTLQKHFERVGLSLPLFVG